MPSFPSDSILVLIETSMAGAPSKSAAGLLGGAAQIGTPVALVVTHPGKGAAAAEAVAQLGAAHVLVAEPADIGSTWWSQPPTRSKVPSTGSSPMPF